MGFLSWLFRRKKRPACRKPLSAGISDVNDTGAARSSERQPTRISFRDDITIAYEPESSDDRGVAVCRDEIDTLETPFHIGTEGNHRVEAWSELHVPYPPPSLSPKQQQLKDLLCERLSELEVGSVKKPVALHAEYWTNQRQNDTWDVENRLFYNICQRNRFLGVTYSQPELGFARRSRLPRECPSARISFPSHYYGYNIRSLTGEPSEDTSSAIVRVNAQFAAREELEKPQSIWLRTCRGKCLISRFNADMNPFSLQILLTVPSSLANMWFRVKPIFDGVVAAMHYYDGEDADELSACIVRTLAPQEGTCLSKDEVLDLMRDPTRGFLGKHRCFLRSGGCSPKDHLCWEGKLSLRVDGGANQIGLQALVFPLRS